MTVSTQNILTDVSAVAPLVEAPESRAAYSSGVVIAAGTAPAVTLCEINKLTGNDPRIQKIAIDPNPSTGPEICAPGGLSDADFVHIPMNTPAGFSSIAERYPGTRWLSKALLVCSGSDMGFGAARQQILGTIGATLRANALQNMIQDRIIKAAAANNGEISQNNIPQPITVSVLVHGLGAAGMGMAPKLARISRKAAERANLPVKVVLYILLEHSPDATAFATADAAQFGLLSAAACASAGRDDVVRMPNIGQVENSGGLFDEVVILDSNCAAQKVLSIEELLALAANVIVGRATSSVIEGDFCNLRAQQALFGSSSQGPAMFSNVAKTSLVFNDPIDYVKSEGAVRIYKHLNNPSPDLHAKQLEKLAVAFEQDLSVWSPTEVAARINPSNAERSLNASISAFKNAAVSDARKAASTFDALGAQMNTLKQAAVAEANVKLDDVLAFEKKRLRKLVVHAICEIGLPRAIEIMSRVGSNMKSGSKSSGSIAESVSASRLKQANFAWEAAVRAIPQTPPRIDMVGGYRKLVAAAVSAASGQTLAEIRHETEQVVAAFPVRRAEIIAGICNEVREGMSATTQLMKIAISGQNLRVKGVGICEAVPDSDYVKNACHQIFKPAAVKEAARELLELMVEERPLNLLDASSKIIRVSGVVLPSSMAEFLHRNGPEARRLTDSLVRKVASGHLALFDPNVVPEKPIAGVLTLERSDGLAELIDPLLDAQAQFAHKRALPIERSDRIVFTYDVRYFAYSEILRINDLQKAYEGLSPERRIVHAPYINPDAQFPEWGPVCATQRQRKMRQLIFDLVARGLAEKNGGDAIRLIPRIVARTGAPNSGLLGRGLPQAIDALDADERLTNALLPQVSSHDGLLGDDGLLSVLEGAIERADLLVPRNANSGTDGFAYYISSQVQLLRDRGAGGNSDENSI